MYAYWRIEEGTEWKEIRLILFDNTCSIKGLLRLCSKADFDKYHKMGISITLDDYVFSINLTQDTKNFQVDQNNPNATDDKTCERSMAGIWTISSPTKITSIGALRLISSLELMTRASGVRILVVQTNPRMMPEILTLGAEVMLEPKCVYHDSLDYRRKHN